MQRTHIRALAALLLLFTVSALAPATLVSPAHAADQAVQANPFSQFDLPGNPKNVYVETGARIWFTLPDSDQIVLLQPSVQADLTAAAADAVTLFPTGTGTKPYDLVMLNGSIWFTAQGTNQIGRVNVGNKQVDLFAIPTANSEPTGIAAGGGSIWFVERKGDNLGRVNPSSGQITEFTDKDSTDGNQCNLTGALLEDVAFASVGPWMVGPKPVVCNFKTANNQFLGVPAGAGSAPMAVAVDASDWGESVWIAANGTNRIGRYAPNTIALWDWYNLSAPPAGATNSGPVGLFIRYANGMRELWYSRPGINRVGRQLTLPNNTPTGNFENVVPIASSAPWGIGTDANGNVWIATSAAAKTVQWKSPYFDAFFYLPMVKRVTGS